MSDFPMSLVSDARVCVTAAVKQDIDSRLEAFTSSEFSDDGHRLNCEMSYDDLPIMIRRLWEMGEEGNEEAESLADDIVQVEWGYYSD